MADGDGKHRTDVLGHLCDSRDNNFNLVRMVAALCVLVSHAWPLALGKGGEDPVALATGVPLGTMGVVVFFGISGFLITQSFDRQPSLRRWVLARALRLFPALAVVLVLTVVVLGPIATSLPLDDYFRRPEVLTYVPFNISLYFGQKGLPGVFEGNPWPAGINGSLWTLFYEVVCYLGVLLIGIFGILRKPRLVALGMLLYALALVALALAPARLVPDRVQALSWLSFPFAIGVGFYIWRSHIRLRFGILAALVTLTVLCARLGVYDYLLMSSLVYGAFVAGFVIRGAIRNYNALGDYSYGFYLYAFPVQQSSVYLLDATTPLSNILVAAPLTLVLAVLSWHFIERPALSLRGSGRSRAALKGAVAR
jgi:peptidoglycan/LPS O-acetylase OafA/YrhL